MCKHCEKLIEDVQHKQLVHDFMAVAALGVNRKLKEDGFPLDHPVTADDIEIDLKVTAYKWHPSSFSAETQGRIMRTLAEAFE